MSDQQVKYTITADASQANSELAKVDKAAASLVGNEKALATETAKATAAIREQGKVASTTSASTETLRQRIGKSAEGLSKQAAAISLVSSSMEGMGGQVGKMVAGAGQMAAAFGAGGPFAAALVGGMALIQGVTDHFEDARLEAERLDDVKFHKLTDGIVDLAKSVSAIKVETQGLMRELDPENAKAGDRAALAEQAVEARQKARKLSNESMAADRIIAMEERLRMREESRLLILQAKALDDKLNVLQRIDEKPKSGGGASRTASRARAAPPASEESTVAEQNMMFVTKMRDEAIAHRLKNEADAREEQARMDKEATEESRRQAEERVKIAEDEASKKQDVAERQAAFVTGQLMQTSDIIAQSALAAAKGQEDAGAILLQGLSQQAGDLITLKGAESAATGLSMLFTGNPAGAVPLAGGLALIGAGQAIAIGGAEVAASMISGASRTPSTDKGASRDKGASPGRNTGSSGGGPLVVNVAYGAGGPLPEDTAREIQKAVDTGRRRGGR